MEKVQNPKHVKEFIEKAFEMYDLSYKTFFNEYDDESGKIVELPMTLNDKLVMPIVERAAMCLGVKSEDLLSLNNDVVSQRYEKFPYFKLIEEYYCTYRESYFEESDVQFLCRAIFDGEGCVKRKHHFDYGDVKNRLLSLIDSYGADYPDLKHEGKNLSYLEIKTETAFQFDRFGELLEAYLDMVQRFKGLFCKAWDADLSSAEISEYNFLVSCLGIRDTVYIDAPLYHDLLKAFIPVYKAEGHQDIFSHIKISKGSIPPFWKCASISDYPDLAKQLAQLYPGLKLEMRETVLEAKNYRCAYLWSDEEKPDFEPDFELFVLGTLQVLGDDAAGGRYHYLYVPKTADEIGGAGEQIERLSVLAGPETMGGLPTPPRNAKATTIENVQRLQARIAVAPKMKWGVDLYE